MNKMQILRKVAVENVNMYRQGGGYGRFQQLTAGRAPKLIRAYGMGMARRQIGGDFWSSLANVGSKILGGVGTVLTATGIGAPIGGALLAAGGLLGATQHPKAIAQVQLPPVVGGGGGGPGPFIGGGGNIGGPNGITIGGGAGMGSLAGGGASSTGTSITLANGQQITKGYHVNKHGYYTKAHGWIEKGTVMVRNRRRNPLNPRAARHAAGRLHGFQKLVRRIEKVVHRAAVGSGHRSAPRLLSSGGRRGHKPGCRCFACKR